jgi:hypothetical protein
MPLNLFHNSPVDVNDIIQFYKWETDAQHK